MRLRNLSLLGLFAIMTCAAIGASHVVTSLRLQRANAELAALRKRLELMEVDDADQVAARSLPAAETNVRRWAIRIPDAPSKRLYANWGPEPLSSVRDIRAKSARAFAIVVDPDTHEATIMIRIDRHPDVPQRGVLRIEHGSSTSIIAIDAPTTSLLLGDTPASSEAIGDAPTLRSASSPITLFATESNGDPKRSFCLWIDGRNSSDGE